jgi:prevent-host-death family protein
MNVAITEAKAQLTELVRRAEAGEEVVLTRHGKPVVRFAPVRSEDSRAARRLRLLELSARMAREKTPGPDAAHAADFLYDDDGLPA